MSDAKPILKNPVWRLCKQPIGEIGDVVFSFAEGTIPEPGDGKFLIRLNYPAIYP